MGPPSYIRSVIDRNVVVQHLPILTYHTECPEGYLWFLIYYTNHVLVKIKGYITNIKNQFRK
jgi:hypothetical protein